MDKPIDGISPEAMSLLESYDWPGNVRELENTMERSVALETAKSISVAVLPQKISQQGISAPGNHADVHNGHAAIPEAGIDLEKYVQDLEKNYLLAALEASDGVGTRAAELLKMSYRSFRHYSKKYNIR